MSYTIVVPWIHSKHARYDIKCWPAGSTIKYGPYQALAPFTQSPMYLHFPNNAPFAEADYLEREIEVGCLLSTSADHA